MNIAEKLLLILVAVIYGGTLLAVGPNIFITLIAIGISMLIRFAFRMLRGPQTIQEEVMRESGYTGLNLNSRRKE